MGYIKLRALLQNKKVPLRVVANVINIDISEMYECTNKYSPATLSEESKDLIFNRYFRTSNLTKEEVFKHEVYDKQLDRD